MLCLRPLGEIWLIFTGGKRCHRSYANGKGALSVRVCNNAKGLYVYIEYKARVKYWRTNKRSTRCLETWIEGTARMEKMDG